MDNKRRYELSAYIIAGAATTAIDWLVTFILVETGCMPTISNAIAIVISIIFAYIINCRWVFQRKPENVAEELRLFLEFVSTRVISSVIQIAGIYLFAERLEFNQFVVKAFANIFVIIFNYIISKLWIFRKE